MLGTNGGWPANGEIDILETTSQPSKTVIPQSIHCPAFNGMPSSPDNPHGPNKHEDTYVGTATSEYHTYGIEWTSNLIKFTIDGKYTWSYDPTKYAGGTGIPRIWPFNGPQYLIINCAIGGTLGGPVGTNYWTKAEVKNKTNQVYRDFMYVDYVRVYQ